MMEEHEETYSGKLKSLRRRVAEEWLESPGKETALSVLDEMVFEAAGECALTEDLSGEEGCTSGMGGLDASSSLLADLSLTVLEPGLVCLDAVPRTFGLGGFSGLFAIFVS